MLKKRNQRRGNRHNLPGRHVHILDTIRRRQGKFVLVATGDQIVNQAAIGIHRGIRLSDNELTLFNRG